MDTIHEYLGVDSLSALLTTRNVAAAIILIGSLWWLHDFLRPQCARVCVRVCARERAEEHTPTDPAVLETERQAAIARLAEKARLDQERADERRKARAAAAAAAERHGNGLNHGLNHGLNQRGATRDSGGDSSRVRHGTENTDDDGDGNDRDEEAREIAGSSGGRAAATRLEADALYARRKALAGMRLPSRLSHSDSLLAASLDAEDADLDGAWVLTVRSSDWRGDAAVRGVFRPSDTLRMLMDFVMCHIPGGMAGRALMLMHPRRVLASWKEYDMRNFDTEIAFLAAQAVFTARAQEASSPSSREPCPDDVTIAELDLPRRCTVVLQPMHVCEGEQPWRPPAAPPPATAASQPAASPSAAPETAPA